MIRSILAIVFLLHAVSSPVSAQSLRVQMVGNAGVMLSDGTTSLMIDLPYQSGAFGYQSYQPDELDPPGDVVSVITHHHADHIDIGLFNARPNWRIIGPKSVVQAQPRDRVIPGDSVVVGAFSVIVIPTPHTPDHRSYRVRWRGEVIYVVGDTESTREVMRQPPLSLLLMTPWLGCRLDDAGHRPISEQTVIYHRRPSGSDRVCGASQLLDQGSTFEVGLTKGSA